MKRHSVDVQAVGFKGGSGMSFHFRNWGRVVSFLSVAAAENLLPRFAKRTYGKGLWGFLIS